MTASLEATVAVPFRGAGSERLDERKFVVALSLERDWFSPDQAKRLLDVAVGRGLVERSDGDVVARFDPAAVEVPQGFTPDESVLREGSTFERILDRIVAAGGDKRTAVAAINARQRDLAVTLEAAAVLHARAEGVDLAGIAERVRADLREADPREAE
ncbi:MAG: DUF2240 family protein [Haloferacaceae archaeon]